MDWQPPTRDEFNKEWFSPEEACGGLSGRLEDIPKKRWLIDRLKAGAIIGVARQAETGDGELRDFVPIPIKLWSLWRDYGDDQFWEFGDAVFTVSHPLGADAGGYGPDSFHVERYLEVKFHPDDFSGGARPRPIPEQPTEAASTPLAVVEEDAPERTKHIGTSEMAKFAKLYLDIWGSAAKEIPAWRAMKACYPDGIIGRDPFLKEFRELRGEGKRGNPAFRGQ